MKKSDLYREWARVLDMCEGTNVDPGLCWMCDGIGIIDMNKKELDILEKAFDAQAASAFNNGLGIIQTKSKTASKLCDDGYLEDVVINHMNVKIRGYALTIKDMVASISCENVTLKVKEKHGSLRAFKARNREIAYQTKIFKELFCDGDEKVLTLADIGVQ